MTTRTPAGTTERNARYWAWQDAAGLAAPAVAVALWALLVAGIAAPLGAALARIDGAHPPAAARTAAEACPVPPGALAAAALRADGARCR